MSKDESITAGELLARLKRDPAYQQRLGKRLDELAAIREARQRTLAPLLDELRQRGFEAKSLGELVRKYAPLDAGIRPLMHDWFVRVDDSALKDAILNVLANTQGDAHGRFLTEQFELTSDASVQWQIAATIEMTRPSGIEDWMYTTARNPALGKSREMLVLAAGKMLSPERARQVAFDVIGDLPGTAATVLQWVGKPEDIAALERAATSEFKWVRSECKKAIAKITRRCP